MLWPSAIDCVDLTRIRCEWQCDFSGSRSKHSLVRERLMSNHQVYACVYVNNLNNAVLGPQHRVVMTDKQADRTPQTYKSCSPLSGHRCANARNRLRSCSTRTPCLHRRRCALRARHDRARHSRVNRRASLPGSAGQRATQ